MPCRLKVKSFFFMVKQIQIDKLNHKSHVRKTWNILIKKVLFEFLKIKLKKHSWYMTHILSQILLLQLCSSGQRTRFFILKVM